MKNNQTRTTKVGQRAGERFVELIAECKAELRAIAEEQLGDYEHRLSSGKPIDWGDVGDVARLLRKLREAQGIED